MKIIEVFPIYNEVEFLRLRLAVKRNSYFNYNFIPALLDCDHQGNPLNFDLMSSYEELFESNEIQFLYQTKADVQTAYAVSRRHYAKCGFFDNWTYELGQRKIIFNQLLEKFEVEGCPDILVLSDADEILFEGDFSKIICSKEQYYRCAMDWYIADPTFMYQKKWPGSLILVGKSNILKFLVDELSPMNYHLTRQDQFCLIDAGKHLTYFGGKKDFRRKCQRIAEASAKRVRLASLIGPLLLKLGVDPMLRTGLTIKKVQAVPELEHLCSDEWGTLF